MTASRMALKSLSSSLRVCVGVLVRWSLGAGVSPADAVATTCNGKISADRNLFAVTSGSNSLEFVYPGNRLELVLLGNVDPKFPFVATFEPLVDVKASNLVSPKAKIGWRLR